MAVAQLNPTVPERLARAARELEEAREHLMEASKALHCDLIPTKLHQDVALTMDACRDRLNELADFNVRLAR